MPFQSPPSMDYIRAKRANFYYDQIKSLYSNMLYSNVLQFSNWALSVCDNKPEIMTEIQQLHVLILSGDSAFHLTEYFRADSFYRSSLQFYKSLVKSSPHLKQTVLDECGSSNEIKFKIHLCLIQCKKPNDALKMLMSVPAKQRNVQTNMALGKLFQLNGMERAAATSYKEVLRVCPMALEAIEQLIRLGSSEEDIQSFVGEEVAKIMPYPEWYDGWIRANCEIESKEHLTGIQIYREVHDKFSLTKCSALLYSVGLANANYGDYSTAISALTEAHHCDSPNMKGMDLLAFLMWHEDKKSDLQSLMTRLNEMNTNECRPEPWIATAYFAQLSKRNPKALMFASKGSSYLGTKVPEGLIAKGHMFFQLKRYQEAVDCFREAMSISANRFEPHKGVVDCYNALLRSRDALTVATSASKKLGCTPRVLTMLASTLRKDPTTVGKAKTYLERALSQEPLFIPSILSLVEIYEAEGKVADAIEFLKTKLQYRATRTPELHLKLANLLSQSSSEDAAADQFALVLKIDPTNREAKEGLNRLDPSNIRQGCTEGFDIPNDMEVEDDEEEDPDPADPSEFDSSIWEDYGTNESR